MNENLNITKKHFEKYLTNFSNPEAMKDLIESVHKNKQFTAWSITKLFTKQFFTAIKESFIGIFKNIYQLILNICIVVFGLGLSPLIYPVILIFKIISSKNHYKVGMKHYGLNKPTK